MNEKKFTAIDLFCGAGGLTVGLKKAGFRVLAGVEIDATAAASYQMNHRKHILYNEDIRKLDPRKVMSDLNIILGELDLLAGCSPCQWFSTHRTRNKGSSVKDVRNNLVYEFLKYVEIIKPKTVMMENVPGLAKDNRIKRFKNKLIEMGYVIDENSISVKDVADYGVPQRRRRMILQASRFGIISPPKKAKEKSTVFDAIGSLKKPGKSGDELHDFPENRTDRIKALEL